jgi:hypothetical protein|tara:strand:- start:115 stop:444 length:330 start_codon:yes stop_codon:yes gene_type:complete
MKNIYVHLGYPKTGSTFIQRKIFPQLKSFKIYDIPFNKKLKIFDIFFLDEKKFNMHEDELINFINIEFKIIKILLLQMKIFYIIVIFPILQFANLLKDSKKFFLKNLII